MESFGATSRLFKSTIQLVEVATLKESQRIKQMSSTAAVQDPMTMSASPRVVPRLHSPSWKQRFLINMNRGSSPRSKWTASFSPTYSSPPSFFSTEPLDELRFSVAASPLSRTKHNGRVSSSPSNLLSSPIPPSGQSVLSKGHPNLLLSSGKGHDSNNELMDEAEEVGVSRITKPVSLY